MTINILRNCKLILGELEYDKEETYENVKEIVIGQYTRSKTNYIIYSLYEENSIFLQHTIDIDAEKDHISIK